MNEKTALIIEDDIEDWQNIKDIFSCEVDDEIGIELFRKSFKIFPETTDEFHKLINNINFIHSPKDHIKESAFQYIHQLLNSLKPDCLILDYELNTDYIENNGIDFYEKLNILIPTIIYTSYTADKFQEIKEKIAQLYPERKIIILQKRDRKAISKKKSSYFLNNLKSLLETNSTTTFPEPKFDKL